jgi:hypothetical protein
MVSMKSTQCRSRATCFLLVSWRFLTFLRNVDKLRATWHYVAEDSTLRSILSFHFPVFFIFCVIFFPIKLSRFCNGEILFTKDSIAFRRSGMEFYILTFYIEGTEYKVRLLKQKSRLHRWYSYSLFFQSKNTELKYILTVTTSYRSA